MTTAVEISLRPSGLYVNGRWVVDLDYARIDVRSESEARFYSFLWGTRCHDEGDDAESLWWVELPEDVKRRVAPLARILAAGPIALN